MPRHSVLRLCAALLGLLAALTFSGRASAGGWAVVVLDSDTALTSPTAPPIGAGAAFPIGFMVLQHGVRPMSDLSPTITARHTESGATVSFAAQPEGATGHYRAVLTLPEPGTWSWKIDAFGPAHPMAPITVVAPPAASAPTPAALPILPLTALGAGGVALALLASLRARRRPVRETAH